MMKLLLFRRSELRQSSPILGMLDEQRKPLVLCLFHLCADDPISCHPLVPRSLRTEEFPSGFVCAKLLRLFTSEPGALALFVRIDGDFFALRAAKALRPARCIKPVFLSCWTRLMLMALQVL